MEVFCIALHFLFAQSSLGILDGMVNSDVSAVKFRLEEEKEKRLLLENDMEILMLKVANLTRTVEKFAPGSTSAFTTAPSIAFMAYRKTILTNLGVNQKLIFDKVATNEGNGYSAVTGIFTVPVQGTYFFTWTTAHAKGYTFSDTALVTGLVVNGEYNVHAWLGVEIGFNMAGNSAVFRLNASDAVWIGVAKGHGVYSNAAEGWFYPTFSGYLIHI
ncbi:hypothetical protein CHS0354_033033 [Potamilus streckersoni]|uniref:C1q domain-containing protein n=1 Tax=Potamilus streckersoni TaxID=2493646 RepID=A0AAE0RXB6_9BIVA|nr:hypothetical protein CHS0354_033033 [Potamilus streckersoni]